MSNTQDSELSKLYINLHNAEQTYGSSSKPAALIRSIIAEYTAAQQTRSTSASAGADGASKAKSGEENEKDNGKKDKDKGKRPSLPQSTSSLPTFENLAFRLKGGKMV